MCGHIINYATTTSEHALISRGDFGFRMRGLDCAVRLGPALRAYDLTARARVCGRTFVTRGGGSDNFQVDSPSSAALKGVRVRYAPSPTGAMHLGGLRTALFNYLFARRHGGAFILRIEDTDKSREVPGAAASMLQVLNMCGIRPDEGYSSQHQPLGPYVQSQRLELYQAAAEQLVTHGFAYKCYYTQEQVEHYRRTVEAENPGGFVFKLGPASRVLGVDFRRFQAVGGDDTVPYTIRLHSDAVIASLTGGYEGEGRTVTHGRHGHARSADSSPAFVTVEDLIRGVVRFPADKIDDAVLLKTDGFPSYHLASVVDDTAMRISHVVRGEEWLPSAPKHVLLYHAMATIKSILEPDAPVPPRPRFAHLPLLLSPTGGKLSKRHSHGSVQALLAAGYEPEALTGFVGRLGISYSSDETMSVADMASEFDLARVQAGSAQVDADKLNSIQAIHFRSLLTKDPIPDMLVQWVAQDVMEALEAGAGASMKLAGQRQRQLGKGRRVSWDLVHDAQFIARVMRVTHERVTKRGDFAREYLYFWWDPPPEILAGDGPEPEILGALQRLLLSLQELKPADANAYDALISLSRDVPTPAGNVRVASGRASPSNAAVTVKLGPLLKALRLAVTGVYALFQNLNAAAFVSIPCPFFPSSLFLPLCLSLSLSAFLSLCLSLSAPQPDPLSCTVVQTSWCTQHSCDKIYYTTSSCRNVYQTFVTALAACITRTRHKNDPCHAHLACARCSACGLLTQAQEFQVGRRSPT